MQFSLGTLFIGVTVICLWLAWRVEQARRQRFAVAELHKLHVAVMYHDPSSGRSERRDVGLGERLMGVAYREPVDYVGFQHAASLIDHPEHIEKALVLLADISGLKRLSLEGMPINDNDLVWLRPLTELRKLNLHGCHGRGSLGPSRSPAQMRDRSIEPLLLHLVEHGLLRLLLGRAAVLASWVRRRSADQRLAALQRRADICP